MRAPRRMSYAQWVSIYVCSFMQFIIFCFTDFVYYCMPIYVPSLNRDFIINIILLYYYVLPFCPIRCFPIRRVCPHQACPRSKAISGTTINRWVTFCGNVFRVKPIGSPLSALAWNIKTEPFIIRANLEVTILLSRTHAVDFRSETVAEISPSRTLIRFTVQFDFAVSDR